MGSAYLLSLLHRLTGEPAPVFFLGQPANRSGLAAEPVISSRSSLLLRLADWMGPRVSAPTPFFVALRRSSRTTRPGFNPCARTHTICSAAASSTSSGGSSIARRPPRAPERRLAQRALAGPLDTAEERRRVQDPVAAGARERGVAIAEP